MPLKASSPGKPGRWMVSPGHGHLGPLLASLLAQSQLPGFTQPGMFEPQAPEDRLDHTLHYRRGKRGPGMSRHH